MPLYSVLLDYRGGTHVEQVCAANPRLALQAWSTHLDCRRIPGFGPASQQQLRRKLAAAEAPVSLNGLVNIHCQTVVVRGHLALINLVETVPA